MKKLITKKVREYNHKHLSLATCALELFEAVGRTAARYIQSSEYMVYINNIFLCHLRIELSVFLHQLFTL